MEWTRERIRLAAVVAAFIFMVTLYAILFRPLQTELGVKGREAKTEETKAEEGRSIIDSMRRSQVRSGLLTASEMSLAIEELTRRGKELGIEFISMSPGEPVKEPDSVYEIIPVRLELLSNYEDVGFFLGMLDELDSGLATVSDFAATPEPGVSSRVKTSLTIHMYLAGEKNAV